MAYIDKETVKKIRTAVKKAYPEIKFSIRTHNHSKIYVTIMKSPYFEDCEHHWMMQYSNDLTGKPKEIVETIDNIIRTEGNYFDESDAMTDYFHTAFYYDIGVGKWDNPHVKV
ncbi:MAG: LPD29 domain-containing protein [Nitrosopumilaceae archaeon]|nr:LPD29 domain-containing protein [Nitrosopumilaceae archaeon]